jgi:ribosomal protein L6P/L9E
VRLSIIWFSELVPGWTHSLELVGVGYRASNQGQLLDLSLGYSHNFLINVPSDVKVETTMEKGKNPIIKLTSHDKQLVGAVTGEDSLVTQTRALQRKRCQICG